ncbi:MULTISPECIES: hypothetical protein [unclassified Streptomyces]|uniref:hypothetical protein n=1 Tax=unclassified Streptomyces TaxID=2593676 RepID=UPI00336A2D3C
MHAHDHVPEPDEANARKPQPGQAGDQGTSRSTGPGRGALDARSVQRLQRGAGNAAVSRLLAAQRPTAAPLRPPLGPPLGPPGQAGGPGAQGRTTTAGATEAPGPVPDQQNAVPRAGPGHAAAAASGNGADDGRSSPHTTGAPAIARAAPGQSPGRPERPRPPADTSAVPERLPDGAAAAAAATAASRRGELQELRTRERPGASLLKGQHEAAGGDRPRHGPQHPAPAQPSGAQDGDRDRDRHADEGAGGGPAPQGGDGKQIGFVELDPEPLMPPLWGQSPEQHAQEVRGVKQTLARDRGVGKEKLAAFTANLQAKSAELGSLAPQLTRQVAAARAAAVARIGSAESSGVAAVQAAVSGARSRVRAQAAAARAQVEAAHSAAVAGMQTATTGAQTAMDNGFRASDESVTAKQNDRLTALGELYTRTEQRMREAASHAGTLAVGEGNRRAEQYRAKMIHRDDNWWDGPLTDNRCKAQANAATSVGEAYRDELPKAVDEPIGDMNSGRPEAEKTVRSVADDVRKTLDTVLKQSGKSLTDAHTQTLRGAEDAKRAALQGISQAVAAAEASLTQLQTSQTAAIRAQAGQQRQAAERSATATAAAIGKGVATARAGLDRGLKEFLRILGQDEVPDPEQLEEVLRDTGTQLDEQLESSAKGLRGQADRAATGLGTTAERAAQTMSAAARAASGSAQQTASSAGQTLSRTASQTATGLRQVQQSYAETARAVQTGHQDADRQVLEGLDKAYTELAGKFQQGADQQVKAVAEGLNKAATQDIHPTIDKEAKKARDKVKPRWHTVLTIVVVIVVVVALSIALGPLVIGAVTAGAAALGASAAAASVIGVVVGGAIVGAAAGAVGQVVSNALNGQPLLDGVVKAAIFGAVGGAVGGGASATVARTALSTGARVGVEMAVEVVTEVGLGALDAMISGQAYTWNDVLLGAVTTVAVTGVMAHPRVEAMTARVQASVAGGLRNLGIKVPELAGAVDTPDVDTPAAPRADVDTPAAPRVDAPDAPSPTRPDAPGPTPGPDSGGGPAGTPQPGRGPGGATSWDVSDIDPATGGAGSADGPVRPRDQDAVAAELRGALGSLGDRVDVTIDPDLPGRTVRVHYDIGEDGLITNVRMAAGPSATPTDIRLHAPTARTMLRYGGLSGRVRQLLRQVTEWVGIHGSPPVGTRAWEARLELRKLPNVIADRARAYADADPAARAELEAELASLIAQVEVHAATLKEWNLDPGRGYVAAESMGRTEAHRLGYTDEDLPPGHTWRKYPDKPLELVQVDTSTRKHWFIPPSAEIPNGIIVDERPPTARPPKPRFDADADPPITREQAFDMLGGNDPNRSLGKFISVLKSEGIIGSEAEFIAKMPDPAGRLHDDVRHTAKESFVKLLAEKINSHADLIRISEQLHGSDRGPVGEAWYQKTHAPDGISQVVVGKDAVPGVTLVKPRRLDLVVDDTIVEIKNISTYDIEIRGQLEDLIKIPGKKISVNGEDQHIALVRFTILDHEGVLNNSSWLYKFLRDNQSADLVVEVFNVKGESREITPRDWRSLDNTTPQGRDMVEWLNGKTTAKGK